MTAKKRKPLDSLEEQFVYKAQEPEKAPASTAPEPTPASPKQHKSSASKESTLIKKLEAFQKQPTVKFTLDLPESLHRKLSAVATKAECKKVDQSAGAAGKWAQGCRSVGAIAAADTDRLSGN